MAANRVLYNTCHGGFSLSDAACERLNVELNGRCVKRHDPAALAVVDELGAEASSGRRCNLNIRHLESEWYDIQDYDGVEEVRDRIQIDVLRTTDTSDTVYELDVSFQELYDAGYITERVPKPPAKSAAETP